MGKSKEFDDFFSLDIPKNPVEYKVDLVLGNAFILVNKEGVGIRVEKTQENKHWKLGDTVHLEK